MKELTQIGDTTICPVVAIVRDGKLLTGLRNYSMQKWGGRSVWTIPGGRCDAGESVETTLRREVIEEVGITDLKITSFLGSVEGAKEGDRVQVFLGTTAQEPKLMEPEKFSEWKWIGLDAIP